MTETNPETSILIPAFNEAAHLGEAVDSVRQSFSSLNEVSYEIVVCDNNSTDQTAEIARSKGVRVVFEPHNQIAKARNRAASAALGKWLIFLDADTQLNPDLLKTTLEELRSERAGGGGSTVLFDTKDLHWGTRVLVSIWNWVSVSFRLAAGAYVYCDRAAWSDVGGFDESVYVSEEIWFSWRLQKWCRHRGKDFRIVTQSPVITSSRKLKWFTPWQITRQMVVILLMPWQIRRRQNCGYWYRRPVDPFPTDAGS